MTSHEIKINVTLIACQEGSIMIKCYNYAKVPIYESYCGTTVETISLLYTNNNIRQLRMFGRAMQSTAILGETHTPYLGFTGGGVAPIGHKVTARHLYTVHNT